MDTKPKAKIGLKQEKGSITLFVLIAMIFFLIVIFGIYINSQNKLNSQSAEIEEIKKNYEQDASLENMDSIYNDLNDGDISVTYSPNGGQYAMPTEGNARLATQVTVTSLKENITIDEIYYQWTKTNTKPNTWEGPINSGDTVQKTDCTVGTYYLWIKAINSNDKEVIKVSNVFEIKNANINIVYGKAPTQGPINVVVDFGGILTSGNKVGQGETISNAKENIKDVVVENNRTEISVNENGYIYAEATDAMGNKVYTNVNITNIDNVGPTVELDPNGGKYKLTGEETEKEVSTVVKVTDNISGVTEVKYGWSTSKDTPPENYTNVESTLTNPIEIKETLQEGTYYLWIKATDGAGNVTEVPSNPFIIEPPLAPTVSLKHNDNQGANYESGTWTKDDVYHEISIPESEGTVEKYQYSFDGSEWKDFVPVDEAKKVNYTTTFPMTATNKPTWLGDVVSNGDYYFDVDETTGALTSDGEHGNKGVHSTTANSYIKIDLTSFTNEDAITLTLNAFVSSQSSNDYGYAAITESETAPEYSSNSGRFIYISGTTSSVTTPTDYSTTLIGGKIYYLHLGYRKSSSTNSGNDVFKINSLTLVISKLYTTTFPINNDGRPDWMGDLVSNGDYYFDVDEETGTLTSAGEHGNKEQHGKIAKSYIPIDLREYSEDDKLTISLNYTISSERNYDYGYATITETTTAPAYNSSTNQFIKVSGDLTTSEKSITISGGKLYYLHLGYRKDGSGNSGTDSFVINSITLSSETIFNPLECYDYNLAGNILTYKLKEDINKNFYIKAIYTDNRESRISNFGIAIDKTAPLAGNIGFELVNATQTKIQVSDIKENGSGIKGYYYSTEQTMPTESTNWINLSENNFEINNLNVSTKYYIWLIDNVGNISEVKEIQTGKANYLVDGSIYKETLEQAIEVANDNSKIELLNDYTDDSVATVNKNILLDTKEFTLNRTKTITLSGGNAESSRVFEFNGKVTSSSNISTLTTSGTVNLKGSGTIENTASDSSYSAIENSGTLVMDGDLTVNGYYRGVENSGTFTLNSGKVEATYNNSSSYAIYNYYGDIVNINGGEVTGYIGLYNRNSSNSNISGGKITSTGSYGVYNSSGTLTMTGGEILAKTYGIYAYSSGLINVNEGKVSGTYGIYVSSASVTINVTGGTVTGSTYGIYGYTIGDGKLTIGDLNVEVNNTSPVISGGEYGVNMRNSNSYNFYNGVIMGTNAKPYSDKVTPREGYMVYTYYDYNDARKYCAVLTKTVDEITIEQTPVNDVWTNQDVTLQVKYPLVEGSTLQYSENNQDWEDVENGYTTTASENKTVYARMVDASGIILASKEHQVTNIDKIVPEVKINPETTKYTIYDKEQKDVDISVTVNISDEGGSNLKQAKYGWSEDKETKPTEWFDLSDGQVITKENCLVGTYYLWFDVSDNAGNVSDIDVIRYIVELQEAVAKIGDKYYYTIQDAIDEASTTETTIVIIKDTDEVSTVAEGQNIILDLNGHTVGSSTSEQPTFTNNGTLTIIDNSEEKTGTIENLVGKAIENNGTLTIGNNTNAIDDNTPTISGKKIGIDNNNVLNYYDGTIIGKSAIDGNVQGTPESYGPVGEYREDGMTVVNLRVVSDYVARIDWFYYSTLQSAFDDCVAKEINNEQTTVHMLTDIVLENTVVAYKGQNIQLDLSGYMLTNSNNTVLENYGDLEITDLTEEQKGNITSSIEGTSSSYYKLIINNGYLNISGGNIISEQKYNYPIYNKNGIVEIIGGEISSSNYTYGYTYGIYNIDPGIINIKGGKINCSSSSRDVYGIYNSGGIINIERGEISSSSNGSYNSEAYGIYNSFSGRVNVLGGKISSGGNCNTFGIYDNGSGTISIKGGEIYSNGDEASNGVYNFGGTINISGGKISSSSVNKASRGIYNGRKGTINIKEAVINSNSMDYNEAFGIYNESSGTINIEESRISSSSDIYNAYGIVNNSTGTINIKGGEISVNNTNYSYYSCGIYNKDTGIINIEKGDISSNGDGITYGIRNNGKGTINVLEGTISSSSSKRNAYGLYNDNTGTIILGVKGDGIVSTNEPNIIVNYEGTSTIYMACGICNIGAGIIDFYDGIIKSNGYMLMGGIAEIEYNSQIIEDEEEGYKRIYLSNLKNDEYVVENINTNKQYTNMKDAINDITDNECELKIIKDFTLVSDFIIPEDKSIKLDLNGKTITNKYFEIACFGDLEIIDGLEVGKIENYYTAIVNLGKGDLTIKGGEISSNDSSESYHIDYNTYGICNKNTGIININGGKISSNISGGSGDAYGIYNTTTGTININGGEISSSNNYDDGGNNAYGIYNEDKGIININGGEISSTARSTIYGIYNEYQGTININGGIISVDDGDDREWVYGIWNSNYGIINITGGQINSSSNEVAYGILAANRGTINITGGQISSSSSSNKNGAYGVSMSNKGKIVIGTKGDGIVSTEEPNIIATCLESNGYGLSIGDATFNFYDGRIEGSTRATYDDSGADEVEETQAPQFSEDRTVYAYGIQATDVARIGDKTYISLQDAINDATETDIIEILRGIQYTNQDVNITIPENKNITIDLKNNPIYSSIEDALFTVEGRLKIIDTVEGENGKIVGSNSGTIYVKHNGTFEVKGGNITNNEENYNVIENEGTVNIIGGIVSTSNSRGYAINNLSTGIVNVSSGTVNAYNTSIYNQGELNILGGDVIGGKKAITNAGSGNLNIQNGNINTKDGSSTVIENTENSSLTMSGGTISFLSNHATYGIKNTSSGNINITGGTISLATLNFKEYAIYSTSGTINIGTKDGTINTDSPNISATTNGIYADCTLNFYDGTITGGVSAISGDIYSIEEQSELVVTGNETVTLTKVDSPIASVGNTEYYSLKQAVENITGTGTIKILRNGTVAEPITIPADKNITIDLNGNTLNMYMKLTNEGSFNLTDTNQGKSGILTGYKDRVVDNKGTFELNSGTISGMTYGVYNNTNGIANITGGTLTSNTYGIYNASDSGNVNVTNGTITGNTYGTFNYKGNMNVSGGNITGNENGIYNSSGTTNITGGTFTGNTTEVCNGGTGTINIISGTITGATTPVVNSSSGRINIGTQDASVSKDNPVIQGEEFGIANTGTGAIAFYDGIIKGKQGAIQGYYLYTETGYKAQTDVIDGYYCDTLALSGTVTTVAKIGETEYTNLQSAINACTSETGTTVTLVNSINTNTPFIVEEGQNVILDLNGKTITTANAENTIQNDGILTIIDSSSAQSGKVTSTFGTVITNSGTLTLGQNDSAVSTTCPEISGVTTAIVNTGTFNFYDGIIKGAVAIDGTVTSRADGYVINKRTENSVEILTLSK